MPPPKVLALLSQTLSRCQYKLDSKLDHNKSYTSMHWMYMKNKHITNYEFICKWGGG